jgi:hypothetical protein
MKTKTFSLALLTIALAGLPAAADIGSLSHLFRPGRTLADADGDGLIDRAVLTIIIPNAPTSTELILAGDIAARANMESLVQNFGFIRREDDVPDIDKVENAVILGANVGWLREAIEDKDIVVPELGPNQGFVGVYAAKSRTGLFVVAGSEDALLQTGRAFFLRWPYIWDIWGREEGATYDGIERDVTQFLTSEGIGLQRTVFRSALYEFPPLRKGPGALKKLNFSAGEIKDLAVDIYVPDEDDLKQTFLAFDSLRGQHAQGQKSEVLSYAGCARLSFSIRYGKRTQSAAVPRLGAPKRMLTPSYRDPSRGEGPAKDFDLLSFLSAKGAYGDMDRDGIADSLDTKVIVGSSGLTVSAAEFASRLVLDTAGASFPVFYLDKEIENRKTLASPVLLGPSALLQDLQRIGKFIPPPLENAWGAVQVIPRAFGRSNALAVLAADQIGQEKVLAYFIRTFPYFDSYGNGRPQLADIVPDLEKFLKGERGSAEAYFALRLKKLGDEFGDKALEAFMAEIFLPRPNPKFEEEAKKAVASAVKFDGAVVRTVPMNESKTVFEKESSPAWEGREAIDLVRDKIKGLTDPGGPIRISVGLSESPEVRQRIKKEIETICGEALKVPAEVEVLSSYKQGYAWLAEKVLPALKGKPVSQVVIRFAEEADDRTRPKRFYAEPTRWLQELYPIDEFLSRDLGIPLDKIHFEMTASRDPVYEVVALDARNSVLLQEAFSPQVREMPYLKALPEWGSVKVTTGWLRIEREGKLVFDGTIASDLERIWEFYQDQVLAPLQAHILRKTGGSPSFSKQPYFKRLKVEVWASEPDARSGLDEEVVSSLEALHDEIYFDTLDFLRGISDLDVDDQELPEDTSRFSAPGNIFPVIHPSSEGEGPRIKVSLEDWPAASPALALKWKEKGKEESTRRVAFPALKSKALAVPGLTYNGLEERIETVAVDMEFEREADYLAALDIVESYRELVERGLLADPLAYPNLHALLLRLKTKDMAKDELLPMAPPGLETRPATLPPLKPGEAIVATTQILSPEAVRDIVARLAQFPSVRTYAGGMSYENRPVPVIEIFKPLGTYVSLPRLIAHKPTLFVLGRQHANEVASTSYILKLAEILATDKAAQDSINRINFVFQPMENPDGAALAYELQSVTPFHSLHAGRYGSLGIDVGSMSGLSRPILPEALVRRTLNAKWRPDIFLNLHGYPSHEWVQQFSNYSPYLFREYWIPRGWYDIFRYLSLPIYSAYKEAGEDLMGFIIAEMQSDPKIKESNKKFYDRYERWATRWQPHLDPLELRDGLSLIAKRRSSTENRLSQRTETTFVEETPEVMDETARGAWLDFLSTQGLAYLKAHMKYLAQAKYETARVEEEAGERVRIQFLRARPPASANKEK